MNAITTFHKDLIVVDHTRLDSMSQGELIELAKETNGKTLKSAKQTLLHAGQTGFVLLALKQKSEHGSFMMSVKHSIGISHRTASNYMGIALNYASVSSLRGVSDAIRYIREASTKAKAQNGNVSNLPDFRTPARLVDVYVDAEIVEPGPDIKSVSMDEIDEADDIETLVVDGTYAPKPNPNDDHIPSDGKSCAIMAQIKLDRILDSDIHFQSAMEQTISYCENRMKPSSAPKTKPDTIRLPNDEAIDAHLFSEMVRLDPEWKTMHPDFLKETKDKYLTRSTEESDRKILNILFELWVIGPAIRAEILNGIIKL